MEVEINLVCLPSKATCRMVCMSVLRLTDHLLLIPNAELQRDIIILGSVNGAPSHLLFFAQRA